MLITVVYFAIHNPKTQTYLTKLAANWIGNTLKTKVSVGEVSFDFTSSLLLRKVYVQDLQGDTLIFIEELGTRLFGIDISNNRYHLKKVSLKDSKFYLNYNENIGLNLDFIIQQFASEDSSESAIPYLQCDELVVENFHFKYDDYTQPRAQQGIDYSHLDIAQLYCNLQDFSLVEDSIFSTINHLRLHERSGFKLLDLNTKAKIASNMLSLKKLQLKTEKSEIKGNVLFEYNAWSDYTEFLTNVSIQGNLEKSAINFSDIAYFDAQHLWGIDFPLNVKGKIQGTIGNFYTKDAEISFGKQSFLKGNVTVKGIPDIEKAYITASIKNLVSNANDLRLIPIPPFDKKENLQIPEPMTRLGNMRFSGNYAGYFSDFTASGNFFSDIGNLTGNLAMSYDSVNQKTAYTGDIAASEFHVGKLIKDTLVGKISMKSKIIGTGLTADNVQMRVEGVVQHIFVNRYRYQNITLNADISKKTFNGDLFIAEKNIDMAFHGKVNLSKKIPEFNFSVDLNHADLFALKLSNRDSISQFSTHLSCDFIGLELENVLGSVSLKNTCYKEGTRKIQIKNINLSATKEQKSKTKTAVFASDFAEGTLIGNFESSHLPESFKYILSVAVPEFFESEKIKKPKKEHYFNYDIIVKNIQPILSVFYPDLQLHSDVTLKGSYNSVIEEFNSKIKADSFTLNGKKIDEFETTLNFSEQILSTDIYSKIIQIADSAFLTNVHVLTKTTDNNIQFGVTWNSKGKYNTKGDIGGLATVYNKQKIKIGFFNSDLVLADSLWTIKENNKIVIDSSSIMVDQFILTGGNESLEIDGRLSKSSYEKLYIKLHNFNLKYVNLFVNQNDLKIKGYANGEAELSDLTGSVVINSNLELKNIEINDVWVGNGTLNTVWNPKKEALTIQSNLTNKSVESFKIKGNFYPYATKDNIRPFRFHIRNG